MNDSTKTAEIERISITDNAHMDKRIRSIWKKDIILIDWMHKIKRENDVNRER